MKASAISRTLPELFAAKLSVFIKGPVGVGKSAVVSAVGKRLGIEVRDWLRASQMDPTDIKGFPSPDVKKGVMRWLPANFLPQDPKSKGILFLDELTSGSTAVQAACYQLMLDRRVGDYELPDGWAIVAAGNREIDRSIVNRMPAALANRMVHIDFEANLQDFTDWAIGEGDIDPITIAFLRFRENLLHNFNPDSKEAAFPTPRSWAMTDKIAARGMSIEDTLELIKGTVGQGAAGEYIAFREMAMELPNIEEISLNPDKAPVPESPNAQYAVTTMCSVNVKDTGGFKTMLKYMERMPIEFQVVFIRDMLVNEAQTGIKTTKEWLKWALKNQEVTV